MINFCETDPNNITLTIFIIILTALYWVSSYQEKRNAVCKSTKKLFGKTAIVTGGTAGIGLEIAKDFAQRGARVIVACPFAQEGLEAQKLIIQKSENEKIVFKLLDLSSLQSVREFAEDILKTEERLDILVNNAGVGVPGDFLTADGMHFIMQVNYYGHFLLTLLLLPLLKQSGTASDPGRIINTTSLSHRFGSFDVDKFNQVGYWNKIRIYATSKLCFILFSSELTKRLGSVIINDADPGLVATRIYQSFNPLIGRILRIFLSIFFKTSFEGAQTAIHMAVDDKAGEVSGRYFVNCEITPKKYWPKMDVAAENLWKQSIGLVKLDNDELQKILV